MSNGTGLYHIGQQVTIVKTYKDGIVRYKEYKVDGGWHYAVEYVSIDGQDNVSVFLNTFQEGQIKTCS